MQRAICVRPLPDLDPEMIGQSPKIRSALGASPAEAKTFNRGQLVSYSEMPLR